MNQNFVFSHSETFFDLCVYIYIMCECVLCIVLYLRVVFQGLFNGGLDAVLHDSLHLQ